MHIINLTPLEEGVYNEYKSNSITIPLEGWAMIPEDMALPSTFPRLGSITAEEVVYPYEVENENGEVEQHERVIMTAISMTEGTLPPAIEPEPTDNELQWRAITDLEIAQMEYEQALTDLEIAQLEG